MSSETPATYNFEEAERIARSEAKRILQLDSQAVRYVKYVDFLNDHCLISIEFDETGRGPITFWTLPLEQRQSDEQLTDANIMAVARSGRVLDAIRLYRLLHSADLSTAKRGVDAMMDPLDLAHGRRAARTERSEIRG